MYDARFLDHFQNPRGRGRLPTPTHRGEATDAACGDRLWLELEVQGGRIAAAAFGVEGCAGAIAAGSALVSLLPGRVAAPDAVARQEIENALGSMPRAKRHALSLALCALGAALRGAVPPPAPPS